MIHTESEGSCACAHSHENSVRLGWIAWSVVFYLCMQSNEHARAWCRFEEFDLCTTHNTVCLHFSSFFLAFSSFFSRLDYASHDTASFIRLPVFLLFMSLHMCVTQNLYPFSFSLTLSVPFSLPIFWLIAEYQTSNEQTLPNIFRVIISQKSTRCERRNPMKSMLFHTCFVWLFACLLHHFHTMNTLRFPIRVMAHADVSLFIVRMRQ